MTVRVSAGAGADDAREAAVRRFEVVEATDDARETLETFAMYRKSMPFGVFLALGAAPVILYGPAVSRFVLETWPRFITGGRSA